MSSPLVVTSCGTVSVTSAMQYWWYLTRGVHEGGSYSDCVGGVWCGPLCIFCLVSSYLLHYLRLRGGVCQAVLTVVVPKVRCTSRLT